MLIRPVEAARILGVSRQRVDQLIASGQLHAAPDVSFVALDEAEVRALAAKQRPGGRPKGSRPQEPAADER